MADGFGGRADGVGRRCSRTGTAQTLVALMRFTYSSLTIGQCSLTSLADPEAANSPKSADGTYASSACRSSCDATCRARAMRCGFRTRACAYVSTFSHRSASPRQDRRYRTITCYSCKTALLRTPRILRDDKFNLRHRAFRTGAKQNRRPSIRYIQHASCNGNDADPWKRFPAAEKKAPTCVGAFRYHER